jgi:hypothetical protein
MKILNRAKCKYSDNYVIGQWLEIKNQCFIIEEENSLVSYDIVEDGCFDDGMLDGTIQIHDSIYEVEKETRSIYFPDMIASDSDRLLSNGEKDLRIFASLSENAKGGDILEKANNSAVVLYNNYLFFAQKGDFHVNHFSFNKCKITGIQK